MPSELLTNLMRDYANRADIPFAVERIPQLFELYTADTILGGRHGLRKDTIQEKTLVGGGQYDGGLDSVAILVNNYPVKCMSDINSMRGTLKVTFIFIQTKSSSNFDADSITALYSNVREFFDKGRQIPYHDELEELSSVAIHILTERIGDLDPEPVCLLYYATAGTWQEPTHPRNAFDKGNADLNALEYFGRVAGEPIDLRTLRGVNGALRRGVTKRIEVRNKVGFTTQIPDVKDAYYGLISGDQFIKLISNNEGDINTDIFYRNVRDYQGSNEVNKEISTTLRNDRRRVWFPLLNNGITIVADELHAVNMTNEIELSNYQIVNGCQTANIFFDNIHDKECLRGDCCCIERQASILIPIKIVVTDDDTLIDEVIKATNNQTKVEGIDFEALDEFHVDLEEYYSLWEQPRSEDERIYYERRRGQYRRKGVPSHQIIDLETQLRAFVAMFLNGPHRVGKSYSELMHEYRPDVFYRDTESRESSNRHDMAPYYVSGVALRWLDKMIRSDRLKAMSGFMRVNSKPIWVEPRNYRYQIIMLLRNQIRGGNVPPFTPRRRNGIEEYSMRILNRLRDSSAGLRECRIALQKITQVICENNLGGENQRNSPRFTDLLLDENRRLEVRFEAPDGREEGAVLFYDSLKEYGFIERFGDLDNIYMPGRNLFDIPPGSLRKGRRVTFEVGPSVRRGQIEAKAVRLA